LESGITAVGSVRARTEAALSFDVSGRVREVLVQPGDLVDPGQSLARLDAANLELQLRSAEASLSSALAQLDELQQGPRPEEVRAAQGQVASAQAALDQALAQRDQLQPGATEAEIAAAEAAVRSATASYDQVKAGPSPEEIAQAKAALDSAEAALQQAQAAYDRVKDRADVGLLPETLALQTATIERQRAQAAYNALISHPTQAELAAAAAQLAQAQAHLAQLKASAAPQVRIAESAVAAATAQRDIAQAQLDLLQAGASSAAIASAESQVEQAQIAVDSARLALERASLDSPTSGRIARVDVEPGESVAPYVPVVTIVSESQFSIEADVDEADIGWIRMGQDVLVTFDAFPDHEVAGQVVSIAPLADTDLGIVSYRVTIQTEPTDLPIRAGMTATAELVRDQRTDVLLVPNLAISYDTVTGQKTVDRKVPDGTERVEIETGLTTDLYSEVLAGLEEGDQVVITSLSAREQFREMMGSSFTGGSDD
jgi:HlyD family secretion protein